MATYNAYSGESRTGTNQNMSDQDLYGQIQGNLSNPDALAAFIKSKGLSRQQVGSVLAANGQQTSAIQDYMNQNKGFDPWGGSYGPGWTGRDPTQNISAAAMPTGSAGMNTPQSGPVQNPYQPQASVQPPAAQPMVAPTAPTQTAATGSISNPYQQPQGGFVGTSWNGSSYGQNPYTGWQAGAMTQQVSDMLTRSALPAINNQAMSSGGVGGSRQGVAQGMAIGDAAKGLSSGLAGLYSGNYAQDQGFGLQSDRLNLDVYNANQNWMNQGQNNQINYMDKLMGWNQQGLQNATTQQNTPLNYAQAFGGMANAAGGQGTSQTNQGNPWLGALGGYMTGSKMFGG